MKSAIFICLTSTKYFIDKRTNKQKVRNCFLVPSAFSATNSWRILGIVDVWSNEKVGGTWSINTILDFFSNFCIKPWIKHFVTLKGLWQINARLWIWLWRSQNSDFQSQFSMSKIIRILPIFFSLKNIKSGAQLILMTLFVYCHFWSTLFTKIRPKFHTLILNLL